MSTKTYLVTLQVSVQLSDDAPTIQTAQDLLIDRVGRIRCVYPEGMRVLTTAASSVMTQSKVEV